VHGGHPGQEVLVGRELGEPLRTDVPQELDRVAPDGVPDVGVDALEQVEAGVVPGPPQVHDQLGQGREGDRKGQADGEPAESSHLGDPSHSRRGLKPCPARSQSRWLGTVAKWQDALQ